jgi:hypothetical protein
MAVEKGERVTIERHGRILAEIVQPSAKRVPKFRTLKGAVQMTEEQILETMHRMTDDQIDSFSTRALLIESSPGHDGAVCGGGSFRRGVHAEGSAFARASGDSTHGQSGFFPRDRDQGEQGLTRLTREHMEKLIFDLELTVLPLIAEHSFQVRLIECDSACLRHCHCRDRSRVSKVQRASCDLVVPGARAPRRRLTLKED